jgi:hypothetical protein
MMSSETKKWSSGMRTRGALWEMEEAGEEGTGWREPEARRASTGAEGERRRSRGREMPAAVRRASMTVSSAASCGERASLSECQRARRPEESRRASSALFQERTPGAGKGCSGRTPGASGTAEENGAGAEIETGEEETGMDGAGTGAEEEAGCPVEPGMTQGRTGTESGAYEEGVAGREKEWAAGPRPT